jgi:hypothetical protein
MANGERRDWTEEELDLIVADYFSMLDAEIRRAPYDKPSIGKPSSAESIEAIVQSNLSIIISQPSCNSSIYLGSTDINRERISKKPS